MTQAPLILRQEFAISCEQLFALLSTPAHMEAWFSPADEIPVAVQLHEFRVGGRYQLRYLQPDGEQLTVAGRFMEIDAAKLICFTWEWQQGDEHAAMPTVVTWILKPIAKGTELTVIHEQMPDHDFFARHREGWLGALQRLRNKAETCRGEF